MKNSLFCEFFLEIVENTGILQGHLARFAFLLVANLQNAAKRELKEELGLVAKEIFHLGDIYPSVGCTNEIIHLYYANNFEYSSQELDEDEFINAKKVSLNDFDFLIKTNRIKDAKTIAAYLMYKNL